MFYVLNKTKQYCVTSTQIFLTQAATSHSVMTIGLLPFADEWEESFLNDVIAANIYGGISSTISIISVISNGNYQQMNTGDKCRLYGENMLRINSSNLVSYINNKIGYKTPSILSVTAESLTKRFFSEAVTTKFLPIISFAQTVGMFALFRGFNYLLNKDVNFLRDAFPVNTSAKYGLPKFYAYHSTSGSKIKLMLAPTPDQNYEK